MNIAILTLAGHEFKGGVEKFNSLLAQCLQSGGHTVQLFAFRDIKQSNVERAFGSLWNKTPYRDVYAAHIMAKEFSKHQKNFDLVIANDFFGLFVEKIKKIVFLHGYYGEVFNSMRHKISFPYWLWGMELARVQRMALKNADLVVTPCRGNYDYLKKRNLRVDRVIPHGIDAEFYKPIAKPDKALDGINLPKDDFLLYVGSKAPWKNFEMVERASEDYKVVALSRKEEGSNATYLENFPEESMPALYSKAAMLLHPSLSEGFGYSVAESMSCGTPALFTMTGFGPELAQEMPELVLENPSDYTEAKQKISFILGNRKSLSPRCRKFIEENNSLWKWRKQWLEAVEAV